MFNTLSVAKPWVHISSSVKLGIIILTLYECLKVLKIESATEIVGMKEIY